MAEDEEAFSSGDDQGVWNACQEEEDHTDTEEDAISRAQAYCDPEPVRKTRSRLLPGTIEYVQELQALVESIDTDTTSLQQFATVYLPKTVANLVAGTASRRARVAGVVADLAGQRSDITDFNMSEQLLAAAYDEEMGRLRSSALQHAIGEANDICDDISKRYQLEFDEAAGDELGLGIGACQAVAERMLRLATVLDGVGTSKRISADIVPPPGQSIPEETKHTVLRIVFDTWMDLCGIPYHIDTIDPAEPIRLVCTIATTWKVTDVAIGITSTHLAELLTLANDVLNNVAKYKTSVGGVFDVVIQTAPSTIVAVLASCGAAKYLADAIETYGQSMSTLTAAFDATLCRLVAGELLVLVRLDAYGEFAAACNAITVQRESAVEHHAPSRAFLIAFMERVSLNVSRPNATLEEHRTCWYQHITRRMTKRRSYQALCALAYADVRVPPGPRDEWFQLPANRSDAILYWLKRGKRKASEYTDDRKMYCPVTPFVHAIVALQARYGNIRVFSGTPGLECNSQPLEVFMDAYAPVKYDPAESPARMNFAQVKITETLQRQIKRIRKQTPSEEPPEARARRLDPEYNPGRPSRRPAPAQHDTTLSPPLRRSVRVAGIPVYEDPDHPTFKRQKP